MIIAPKNSHISYGRPQTLNPLRRHPAKVDLAESGQVVPSVKIRCDSYEVSPQHAFNGKTGCQVCCEIVASSLRIGRLNEPLTSGFSIVLSVKTHPKKGYLRRHIAYAAWRSE